MNKKILVSACLMGHNVRYNGTAKAHLQTTLARWQKEQRLVIFCPELAAGLPTPRLPVEIISATGYEVMQGNARMVESTGNDVTQHYQLAAWLALQRAEEEGCVAALLTDGSPTCGVHQIYDGTFSGKTISGMGVATTLLSQSGVLVFSHSQVDELVEWIE
ncbi:TPA: DUF523 domain-containing protein [Providencia alcalifaciens]|uniref:DUF523 domain-containing protein n=1 Tax=Providencia alcalifaciens TaxID=126385 RepID=UPI001CC4294D|nr:DUF523 domain-containing protein [Providencia alcalifaciens]CAG9421162.1 hypothetical protein NVI2019_NGLDDFDA_01968 [Providencia alcalifaciens]